MLQQELKISPSIFKHLISFVNHSHRHIRTISSGICGILEPFGLIGDLPACTQNSMKARCSKMSIEVNVFDLICKRVSPKFGDKIVGNPSIWLALSLYDHQKLLWLVMKYRFYEFKRYLFLVTNMRSKYLKKKYQQLTCRMSVIVH